MSSWWSQRPGRMKFKWNKLPHVQGQGKPWGYIVLGCGQQALGGMSSTKLSFALDTHMIHDKEKAQTYRIGRSRVQQWLCFLFRSTRSPGSNGTNSSCTFKAWTDLERQNHFTPGKDLTCVHLSSQFSCLLARHRHWQQNWREEFSP